MVSVEIIEIGPRMYDMTFLKAVILGKHMVNLRIPSAFVSIAPYNDRRVIYVALNHFFYKLLCSRRVIASVPSGQLINVNQSQRVAHVKEMLIGWVV